jgi:hypothetical protein
MVQDRIEVLFEVAATHLYPLPIRTTVTNLVKIFQLLSGSLESHQS